MISCPPAAPAPVLRGPLGLRVLELGVLGLRFGVLGPMPWVPGVLGVLDPEEDILRNLVGKNEIASSREVLARASRSGASC